MGDRVRYRLNNDTRSKRGGKLAPRYSDEYQVVDVLGDGYTYNLKAVNHNGRDKSRHFNLLKTVHRLEENDSPSNTSTSDEKLNVDDDMSALAENIRDEADTQESSDDQVQNHENENSGRDQERWVRRSRRERKQVEMLQADGKKSHTLHPKLLTSMIQSNWSRKRGVDGTFSLFVSFTTVLELKYHPTFVIFGIQN